MIAIVNGIDAVGCDVCSDGDFIWVSHSKLGEMHDIFTEPISPTGDYIMGRLRLSPSLAGEMMKRWGGCAVALYLPREDPPSSATVAKIL